VFLRGGPTSKIDELFAQRAAHYGTAPQPGGIGVAPRDALVNFMDNHDVPRFLYERPDPDGPRALRAALAYLLTEDGIPCIYYGTEQDFAGGNDPMNREPLWWSGYRTDGETFQWIARLTRIRRGYDALTRGDFELRWTSAHVGDESDAGVVAFERELDDRYALVVINAHPRDDRVTAFESTTMTIGRPAGSTLVDVLTGDTFTVEAGGALRVEVDAYATRILVPDDQVIAEL